MRETILLVIAGLVGFSGCTSSTSPEPVQKQVFEVIVDPGVTIRDERRQFILITDENNNRLGYNELSTLGQYVYYADQNYEGKVNIHHILTDNFDYLSIRSIIGYDKDTYHFSRRETVDPGQILAPVSIELETNDGFYLYSAGGVFFTPDGFLGEDPDSGVTEWYISENSSALFFIRLGTGLNDGYYFDPDFIPESSPFLILNNMLSPVSELESVVFPYEPVRKLDYYHASIQFNDRNGNEQIPLTVFYSSGPLGGDLTTYYPLYEDIKYYIVNLRERNAGGTTKYVYNTYSRTTTPVTPEHIKADIEMISFIPGQIQLNATGEYNQFSYFYGNISHNWQVSILDESLDYASYPDFPDEFYQEFPHGNLQALIETEFQTGYNDFQRAATVALKDADQDKSKTVYFD